MNNCQSITGTEKINLFYTKLSKVNKVQNTLISVWTNACEKCAARGSLKIQDAKNRHFGTIAQLYRTVSSQLRHVSTIGKNLLNIDTSSTCPRNMVSLLTAEICWRVWGTPASFNGFRVLAALLHGNLVVDVSQTLRRW